MQLKITSDGTAKGTKVLDEENKPIGMIQKITWEVSVDEPLAKATIVIVKLPIGVAVNEADVKFAESALNK